MNRDSDQYSVSDKKLRQARKNGKFRILLMFLSTIYFESNGISGDLINMRLPRYLVFRLNLVILLVLHISQETVHLRNLCYLQHLCTFRGRKKFAISSFPSFKGKVQVSAIKTNISSGWNREIYELYMASIHKI